MVCQVGQSGSPQVIQAIDIHLTIMFDHPIPHNNPSRLFKTERVTIIQTFSSFCATPADGDLVGITVTPDFSSAEMRKEMSCLKKQLEKVNQQDIVKLTPSCHEAPTFTLQSPEPPEPRSREEFLQYFCPLTLDINTAHRVLRLSEGNKKVRCEKTKTKYPNHPDRFDWWEQVLCKEALTGTRCYWEVEWSGDVMAMGVTYKGLSRKGNGDECRLGYNDKSWTLVCSQSWSFVCHSSMMTLIKAPHSPRIGVYLDWPAGSLSFYSVSQTMTLLHTFNTSFTEPLYPGFWLARNPSVTICHLTSCDH
ncbi:tripartite motif-containing protein 16-like [Erpetoichthys calabaricus]|uniref:tripartite motif-containing protein 16-like n=1 Tax=Erpetoichthys calabaricus TaxID=27687 RepID=UPI0022346068|nr:tripartite motif-containing protein 16-like [Erpetoichthys calabaricus]